MATQYPSDVKPAQVTITRVVLDDAAGYVDDSSFNEQQAIAEKRRDAWNSGVIARATLAISYGRDWIRTTIDSPGL